MCTYRGLASTTYIDKASVAPESECPVLADVKVEPKTKDRDGLRLSVESVEYNMLKEYILDASQVQPDRESDG